jgi:hypothetical protein
MDNQQELVCLQDHVVLQNAVLGDTDTHQACINSTDTSDYRCSRSAMTIA